MTRHRTLRRLAALWGFAALLGLVGLGIRLATGERWVGYGSYVPWGLWVALYFHGVGIAGGAFAVGAIGYLLRIPGLRDHLRVTIWVAAAGLVSGLAAIGLDLGHPFRGYRIFIDPSFTSMMAFNSWMYMGFLAVAAAVFALAGAQSDARLRDLRSGWFVPLLLLGIVLALAFPSQSGVFFGVVDAKPYWSSDLLPALFLSSAVAAGASVLLLVHTFLLPDDAGQDHQPLPYLRWVTVAAVGAYFVFEFAKISIALWSPTGHSREPIELVLFGPFWWVFWIVHVAGGLLALWLLVYGRSLAVLGTGGSLVALTFVSTRLNVLIPGQAMPELRGLATAYTHPRLQYYYAATPSEYLVALFIGALGVGLVYLGLRLLTGFTILERNRAA